MALTMGGWGGSGRDPADLRSIQPGQPSDDYLVEAGAEPTRPPAALQLVRVLQFVLFVAIAAVSLAVFWMVGLIIGIF